MLVFQLAFLCCEIFPLIPEGVARQGIMKDTGRIMFFSFVNKGFTVHKCELCTKLNLTQAHQTFSVLKYLAKYKYNYLEVISLQRSK